MVTKHLWHPIAIGRSSQEEHSGGTQEGKTGQGAPDNGLHIDGETGRRTAGRGELEKGGTPTVGNVH